MWYKKKPFKFSFESSDHDVNNSPPSYMRVLDLLKI